MCRKTFPFPNGAGCEYFFLRFWKFRRNFRLQKKRFCLFGFFAGDKWVFVKSLDGIFINSIKSCQSAVWTISQVIGLDNSTTIFFSSSAWSKPSSSSKFASMNPTSNQIINQATIIPSEVERRITNYPLITFYPWTSQNTYNKHSIYEFQKCSTFCKWTKELLLEPFMKSWKVSSVVAFSAQNLKALVVAGRPTS